MGRGYGLGMTLPLRRGPPRANRLAAGGIAMLESLRREIRRGGSQRLPAGAACGAPETRSPRVPAMHCHRFGHGRPMEPRSLKPQSGLPVPAVDSGGGFRPTRRGITSPTWRRFGSLRRQQRRLRCQFTEPAPAPTRVQVETSLGFVRGPVLVAFQFGRSSRARSALLPSQRPVTPERSSPSLMPPCPDSPNRTGGFLHWKPYGTDTMPFTVGLEQLRCPPR